ncbi:DUF448 domain-containing protein [Sandarakinorhabdus sp.]|uniref:DUF448 domain-containing protein n=1 Tax=Sandarakinorhabdus sp. TaxID=1916663 RepID=UPI003F720F8A
MGRTHQRMEANDRLTPEPPAALEKTPNKDSERRCILTGETAPRASLIRLALGPDGQVAADWSERLPGRGAWISADRGLFDDVAARGRLRGALARAFKANSFTLPDDIGDRIEASLRQRLLARLGLEKRAGNLIVGEERVREALRAGKVWLVLHAGDARPDGADRLDGMARAVGETLGEDIAQRRLPMSRDALSAALGRDNVVHAAITEKAAAARVLADIDRWGGFAPAHSETETKFEQTGGATEVAAGTLERH